MHSLHLEPKLLEAARHDAHSATDLLFSAFTRACKKNPSQPAVSMQHCGHLFSIAEAESAVVELPPPTDVYSARAQLFFKMRELREYTVRMYWGGDVVASGVFNEFDVGCF